MLEVNKDNFEQEVLNASGLVMVDFWSEGWSHCKEIMPSVEALAEKYADKAKFCSLNTGGNRRLAISQKVLGLPNVSFYKGGEKITEVTGEVTAAAIEEELKKHI